jgi:hypothetical protein
VIAALLFVGEQLADLRPPKSVFNQNRMRRPWSEVGVEGSTLDRDSSGQSFVSCVASENSGIEGVKAKPLVVVGGDDGEGDVGRDRDGNRATSIELSLGEPTTQGTGNDRGLKVSGPFDIPVQEVRLSGVIELCCHGDGPFVETSGGETPEAPKVGSDAATVGVGVDKIGGAVETAAGLSSPSPDVWSLLRSIYGLPSESEVGKALSTRIKRVLRMAQQRYRTTGDRVDALERSRSLGNFVPQNVLDDAYADWDCANDLLGRADSRHQAAGLHLPSDLRRRYHPEFYSTVFEPVFTDFFKGEPFCPHQGKHD